MTSANNGPDCHRVLHQVQTQSPTSVLDYSEGQGIVGKETRKWAGRDTSSQLHAQVTLLSDGGQLSHALLKP